MEMVLWKESKEATPGYTADLRVIEDLTVIARQMEFVSSYRDCPEL